MTLAGILTTTSIDFGFISAGAWLRASAMKVTYQQGRVIRHRRAAKEGRLPDDAVIFRGVDLMETQAAQSRWNAAGAVAAAIAMLCQALAQMLA